MSVSIKIEKVETDDHEAFCINVHQPRQIGDNYSLKGMKVSITVSYIGYIVYKFLETDPVKYEIYKLVSNKEIYITACIKYTEEYLEFSLARRDIFQTLEPPTIPEVLVITKDGLSIKS